MRLKPVIKGQGGGVFCTESELREATQEGGA